jgi:2-polyprenyl-6-methoxyphenol hydroxylase-like FAD-dependent oxidoreductase
MEALVVGGGPVGLFAAACLHERGVEVAVVDAEWERPVRSHACALHPETLRLFERLGLMPALQELAHRVDRVFVYRATERAAAADLGALAGPFPHVLTLPQSDLRDLLAGELERRGVEVCSRQEVTKLIPSDDYVCTEVVSKSPPPRGASEPAGDLLGAEPVTRRADYVIGADGYHSMCRDAAGIELIDLQQCEAFAIFDFEADLGELEHEAHLIVSKDAVSAFWPLGPQRGRWTFQMREHLDEVPSIELLTELLRRRAPWFRPRPEQLAWSTTAHFERRVARRFGAGRVWLAGDSAHVTSPIGFQNMNRGFVEARELADVISGTLQGEPAAAGGFERLERGQQAEWRRLFGLGVRVVSQGSLSAVEGARLVACLPASGRDLDALLGQLDLRLVPTWGSVRPGVPKD